MLRKKSTFKCFVLHDSIYIIFSKWQNFRNEEQISECQELETGVGEMRGVVVIIKVRDPCGDGIVHYLECDLHRNLYIW